MKVKLLPSWCTSQQLAENWNKMSQGMFRWNNITLVWDQEPDYYIIINSTHEYYDKKRTILIRMEPYYDSRWNHWCHPNPNDFLMIIAPPNVYNNLEWHLSKTYTELMYLPIHKTEDKVLSAILSDKYFDTGHIKRIDLIKYFDKNMSYPVHVYGSNKYQYKNYKGELPYASKETGLFPYKYTFNVENISTRNYCTEKIVDAILSECLIFYSGCYNIRDIIDERAFVYLELSNLEKDAEKIKQAIENNEWERRLPYIRYAKQQILQKLQFFPRIEGILNNLKPS